MLNYTKKVRVIITTRVRNFGVISKILGSYDLAPSQKNRALRPLTPSPDCMFGVLDGCNHMAVFVPTLLRKEENELEGRDLAGFGHLRHGPPLLGQSGWGPVLQLRSEKVGKTADDRQGNRKSPQKIPQIDRDQEIAVNRSYSYCVFFVNFRHFDDFVCLCAARKVRHYVLLHLLLCCALGFICLCRKFHSQCFSTNYGLAP